MSMIVRQATCGILHMYARAPVASTLLIVYKYFVYTAVAGLFVSLYSLIS